ncbi:Myosin-2 essential light chain [Trachymyrmex cornetzi]|uniref:Myosin-2 essential light chain n=1 Tax=Trachymyrmex cornetzi TaxID=471704 RepID=A0A195DLP2_9HYME|nr:Myosin-2 essential light chain [Trachymyrmex cornetzi]
MVSTMGVCCRPRVMQLMQETRRSSRTDTTSMRLNESATCVCSQASYSEDQLAEFQEAFQLFDSRGDGKIHVSQIGDALRALGQNPTESDVKKFTHQHKPDERISFEVFLPIYQAISKSRASDTADDFIEGLRHFDKDGNGFISSAELRHLLTTLGEKLSDEEVETLLAGHEDSQGNINYEDFVRQVMCG